MIFGHKIINQVVSANLIKALGLLTTVLISRWLGVEVLGQVNFLLGTIGLLSMFTDFGFNGAFVRLVASGRNSPDDNTTFFWLKTGLLFTFLIVSLAYYWLAGEISEYIDLRGLWLPYLLLIGYFVLNYYAELAVEILRGGLRVGLLNRAYLMAAMVKLLVVVVAIGFLPQLWMVALAYLIYAVALVLGTMLPLLKSITWGHWSRISFETLVRYCLPIFVIAPLGYLSTNVGTVMLKLFWSDRMVGLFASAWVLTEVLNALVTAVNKVLFPKIAAEENAKILSDNVRQTVRYISLISVPVVVWASVFNRGVITLVYGNSFANGASLLPILFLTSYLVNVARPFNSLVYGKAAHRSLVPNALAHTTLFLVAATLLIPPHLWGINLFGWGALGLAVAILLQNLWGTIYVIRIVDAQFAIRMYWSVWKHWLAGGLVGLAWLALAYGGWTAWWQILIWGLLGTGLYGLLVIALGEFGKEELRYFIQVLHPKGVLKYLLVGE